jgi:hypothetical protein
MRPGISDHGRDGLVYFVGYQRREPSYNCNAVRVDQLRERLTLLPLSLARVGEW